jgi:hypothetical protein
VFAAKLRKIERDRQAESDNKRLDVSPQDVEPALVDEDVEPDDEPMDEPEEEGGASDAGSTDSEVDLVDDLSEYRKKKGMSERLFRYVAV